MRWLNFSLVLMLVIFQNNADKFGVEHCEARHYGGVCERDNSRVHVKMINKKVEIKCKHGFYSEWNLQLNLSDINELRINECDLPGNESYQMFAEHLGIKKITILRIDSANEKTLEVVNFHGFQDLIKLVIYSSKHIQLAQHLFKNLRHLKCLEINSSPLNFQSDFLHSLTELEHLKLNNFEAKTTYECNSSFSKDKLNLKYLELKGFIIKNVSHGCFSTMPSLENFRLTDSLIEFKTNNSLDAFSSISHFHLINNNINHLSSNLLTSFKYLNRLFITNNVFVNKSIPPGFLSNLKNLLVVEIVSNNFNSIPLDTFKGALSVTNLKLNGNFLSELPKELFQDLKKLQVLELVNNTLSQLHQDIFDRSYELQVLDLSDNHFQEFPKSIVNIRQLKKLNLKNNFIKSISSIKNLKQLLHLEELNLSHNKLNNINGQHWIFLSNLNLSNNNLTSMALDSIQQTSKVPITIDFQSNNIQTVNFHNFNIHKQHVKVTILLANNSMICDRRILDLILFSNEKFAFELGDLQCKVPTMLQGKEIAKLKPEQIVYDLLNCTERCQCQEKPATKTVIVTCLFPDDIKQIITLPHLNGMEFYELILDNNNLTLFPQINDLIAFNKIRKLSMVNNQLTEVPAQLPKELEVIDISNNMFDVINVEAMMNLQAQNTKMLLKGNPLACNCKSNEFLNHIQKHHDSIRDYDELRCHNTPTKFISAVTLDENCFLKSPRFYVMLSSVVVVLTLGVAIYYRCQWDIKKWLHAHNIYNYPVLEEEINSLKEFDAFVMYSKYDEEFVENQLMTHLEEIDNPWKLCIHVRDFEIGTGIMTNVSSLL